MRRRATEQTTAQREREAKVRLLLRTVIETAQEANALLGPGKESGS
jgi:hypothetical protein